MLKYNNGLSFRNYGTTVAAIDAAVLFSINEWVSLMNSIHLCEEPNLKSLYRNNLPQMAATNT